MEDKTVLQEIRGSSCYITLNRPKVHNALDDTTIQILSEMFDALARRDDIRVVILRGEGKSFCAGADLGWMKRAATYTEEENLKDAVALAEMLDKLYTLPQLTIACVQGAALGGGVGIVACCDMVFAHDKTVFGLSEVRLGLIPATIAPYVLRAMGEQQARRYFQTAERFSGAKAKDIGLVHEIYQSADECTELLEGLLETLASNGPEAMRGSKRLCLDYAGKPIIAETLIDTAGRIARIRAGDEAKEGLAAFLEKRPASWTE